MSESTLVRVYQVSVGIPSAAREFSREVNGTSIRRHEWVAELRHVGVECRQDQRRTKTRIAIRADRVVNVGARTAIGLEDNDEPIIREGHVPIIGGRIDIGRKHWRAKIRGQTRPTRIENVLQAYSVASSRWVEPKC